MALQSNGAGGRGAEFHQFDSQLYSLILVAGAANQPFYLLWSTGKFDGFFEAKHRHQPLEIGCRGPIGAIGGKIETGSLTDRFPQLPWPSVNIPTSPSVRD